MSDANYLKLQDKIGYRFNEPLLLREALTHSSYSRCFPEDVEKYGFRDNERLEFLGDAVLGLCVGEKLFLTYKGVSEGAMSRARAAAVCEEALYLAAKRLGVAEHIIMSYGEVMSGGRDKPSILSDAMEAVIGAIYLDGGLEQARQFVMSFTDVTQFFNSSRKKDSKTRLQEYVQERRLGNISYQVVEVSGPDHKRVFTIEVRIDDKVHGTGTGSSKHDAGMNAAANALHSLTGK